MGTIFGFRSLSSFSQLLVFEVVRVNEFHHRIAGRGTGSCGAPCHFVEVAKKTSPLLFLFFESVSFCGC